MNTKLKDEKYGFAKSFYALSSVFLYGVKLALLVQTILICLEFFSIGSDSNELTDMYVGIVDTVVILVLIIAVRKILFTAKEGNPFVLENVKQLRLLAVIYIGASVLLGTLPTIFHLIGFVEAKIIVNQLRANSILLNTGGFITGFIFLFLAEVFEVGVNLKNENELTV